MYEYLTRLHQKLIFTKADVVAITKSEDKAASLLLDFQSKGLIVKIRRNLYCVVNLASQQPEASKMQIASAISPTSTVAYHSALEYHGFAHQTFYNLTVASGTRFVPFEFDGILYTCIHNSLHAGVAMPPTDAKVRVTNLERTILDCIDRIDLCGGVEELLNCLGSIKYVNSERLAEYLDAYGRIALYKKAGYVLSLLNGSLHLPDHFFDVCMNFSNRSTATLTTVEQCPHYVSKWKLYVPDNINTYVNI